MTRWCKLVTLAITWSGLAEAVALAQDAPPPPPPPRWSLLHPFRGSATATAASPADASLAMPPSGDAQIGVPPFPGPAGPPPVMPEPQTGAPPPPPFGQASVPPAVAPPGPDRPPNGFSDPIPPDAENGFECNPQPECVPTRPYFFAIDYLHWWVQKQPMPTLVTTGSATDNIPGAFGQHDTRVAISSVTNGGGHDGARALFGYDFDQEGCLGLDVSGFWLDKVSPSVVATGQGGPNSNVLTRPFFNVNTHAPDADPINIPGVMGGTFVATTPLRLAGADANVRWLINNGPAYGPRFTLLLGFNFIDLDEKLLTSEFLTDTPGLGAAGNHYTLGENFTTYNRFYGGQIGGQVDYHVGPVAMIFIGKCAFGYTQETLEISGSTSVTEANGTVVTNPKAALYVGPGNVGHYTNSDFAVVPQGQFKLAYEFNKNFRIGTGYDMFYINHVIRPGDQINTNVNVQPIGGPPVAPLQPTILPFRSSGLWAQGFSLDFEVNF